MTRARTQSVAVLAVVLAICTLAAAPVAVAAPGDSTSGTTIGDQLGGSGDSSDGSTAESDDSTDDSGETTDEQRDDQQSTDGVSGEDDTSTDGSTDESDDSAESDDSWGDEESSDRAEPIEAVGSNGTDATASVSLTAEVTEELATETGDGLEAVTAADLADATQSGAVVPALDAETFGATTVSGTTSTATSTVGGSTDALFGDASTLLGTHEQTTSTDVARVEAPVAQLASAPSAQSFDGPSTNRVGVGGATTGSTPLPPGPTTGLALGLGAIAAAGVGRSSLLAPASLANLGSALTAGLAPVAGRTGLFDRLVRMLAPFRYSRYDDSDPLEHEARADVYDVVNDAPGAYLSEVADEAGLPLSTARHHIRVLEREDLVSGAKVRGKRRFYPAYTQGIELAAALNDEATAAVIDAVSRLGASSVSDLADELGRDPSTVSHHLKRLAEDDIIVRERDGRAVMNKLSAEARTTLEPGRDSPAAEAGEALASD
ncbi:winged helix-turn-helix transcriptional regulator [Halorarius litoreus]|uniref:winged helix-turn-helix transcriptional regulator n=1 Tax=Halorarius litoreus TaxID=2962676 RepID=UPI0020CE024A|nr:helix-turn-helix domain-containing protein [Halorarius litoreus]